MRISIRFPTGDSLGQVNSASRRSITATAALSAKSASLNVRPAISRVPIVSK